MNIVAKVRFWGNMLFTLLKFFYHLARSLPVSVSSGKCVLCALQGLQDSKALFYCGNVAARNRNVAIRIEMWKRSGNNIV